VQNSFTVEAQLLSKESLRYSPIGLAVIKAQFKHRSQQEIAQKTMGIELSFSGLAYADEAKALDQLAPGVNCSIKGALATVAGAMVVQIIHIELLN